MDADVIGAFISGMTNEALVHELGCCKSQMMQELLNLATSHAFGKEAIRLIFWKHKGKAQAEPMDEAKDHNRRVKGKKDIWRHHDCDFVAMVDRVHKQKTGKLNHQMLLQGRLQGNRHGRTVRICWR